MIIYVQNNKNTGKFCRIFILEKLLTSEKNCHKIKNNLRTEVLRAKAFYRLVLEIMYSFLEVI